MSTLQAGDVVTIDFPGVKGIKRRPAIMVSSSTYHQHRPDVIVGIMTSQTGERGSGVGEVGGQGGSVIERWFSPGCVGRSGGDLSEVKGTVRPLFDFPRRLCYNLNKALF